MKVPHWISESEMLHELNSNYAIIAGNLSFIPIGDMSYVYKVISSNDTIYFLKILDKAKRIHRYSMKKKRKNYAINVICRQRNAYNFLCSTGFLYCSQGLSIKLWY